MVARYVPNARHRDLETELRRLMPQNLVGRPFIADGSPFDCAVGQVGINPGTPTPFWDFWDVRNGFDKRRWLERYHSMHGRLKPTRARIELLNERLRAHRCVELNVFAAYTQQERALRREQKQTAIFEYLLAALAPRVLVVHGRSARIQLTNLLGQELSVDDFTSAKLSGHEFEVFVAVRHFSRVSYDYVNEVAARVSQRLMSSE
jgi:hypothetical protein